MNRHHIGRLATLAVVLSMMSGAAMAQTKPAAKAAPGAPAAAPAVAAALAAPAADAMLMMIRTHVLAAGQAIQADNFDVLRAMASAEFRAKNSNEQLAKTFAELAALKLDMGPIVVTTPVLTDAPVVKDNQLRLFGVFPTKPVEIPFGLVFVGESNAWKLGDISVGARPAAMVAEVSMPLASEPAAKPAAAAKPAKK